MAKKELELLRELMKKKEVDICLIPTADSHESEYPGAHFAARRFLSGFTGSAGTLAVSADWSGLWTDARYFLQAEAQLTGSGITLYRMGEEGVPALEEEISVRLPRGGTLAYDGTVVSRRLGADMRRTAERRFGRILLEDLPGQIWEDRPPISSEPVFELDMRYAGQSRTEKIRKIREQMEAAGAEAHILTTLDDIAWLMNLRGNDVPCSPVFMSYCILTLSAVYLFVQEKAFSRELREKLRGDGIELREYGGFYEALPAVCSGKTVMLDSGKVNEQIFGVLEPETSIVDCPNPSELLKAVKNETEADNLREAHRKDGLAVTKFLYWLKKQIGREEITELSAAEYLENCRREQDHYLEPSFTTIAAYGPNAAVVHYSATEESSAVLKPEGLFLVDSGGQYLEGTTDITRTVVLGNITGEQKKHFTAVLKGMLALGDAHFLHGCRGTNLDYLAREPLWAMGLDYKHGTGHGVGYLLNVHEAPNGFRWKMVPERMDSAVLEPGMVTSDEPGVYLAGKYGIRTENLLLCTEAEKTEYGQFLKFEFLTMVPIDLDGIDRTEMGPEDMDRLNRYHRQVYKTLSPYLEGEELAWLKEATRKLV
ncbi:aminopeptidase P family protein [Lacrimispora sp. NSJ-141]|uniref:Aminopeptidase P family protein n=1 Tax=Lientehia hominis TaxID=2897778 RepID=A0AAP2W9I4_9FIRM|nr:aminopeptidase P family protein [Lientehia hominis]MCD2491784.1 aminopeptidase P family protein [Lientehia hominis]